MRIPILLVVLAIGLLSGGCDNTIDPILDGGPETFALHGYLDMASDTQFVRIQALRPTLLSDPLPLNNLQVVSVDESVNAPIVWQDSTIRLDNGDIGTLFYAAFAPAAGHTYRIDVQRPGQDGGSARTTVPPEPDFMIWQPSDYVPQLGISNLISPPDRLQILYTVSLPEDGTVRTVAIDYGVPPASSQDDTDRLVYLQLVADSNFILAVLRRSEEDQPLIFKKITASIRIPGEEWTDRDKASNLRDLMGFFASVGHFQFTWRLDPQVLDSLGFVNGQVY